MLTHCMNVNHDDDGSGHRQQDNCLDPFPLEAHTYTLTYRRTLTVESEVDLTIHELLELARESLTDKSALWSVQVNDGDHFCLPPPA